MCREGYSTWFVCVCYHVFCQYAQQDDNIEILARFLIGNDLIKKKIIIINCPVQGL